MNKYRCSFLMGLENSLEYRFDFFMSLASTVFPIIIQTFLWTAIYQSPSDYDNGYTYPQIILYTLLAGMVSKLVASGFEYTINEDIKNGGLNKYVIRPVSYLKYQFCVFMGSKVSASFVLLIITAIELVFAVLVLELTLTFGQVLLFLIGLIFALVLNFALFFCVAMISFWLTDVSKLFGSISIVIVVISGGVFPLDIFGERIALITGLLPFKYTTQFPVDILNGKLAFGEALYGITCQGIWIVLLFLLAAFLWKRGLKRFVAVGG